MAESGCMRPHIAMVAGPGHSSAKAGWWVAKYGRLWLLAAWPAAMMLAEGEKVKDLGFFLEMNRS